jgi:hypothetical protein
VLQNSAKGGQIGEIVTDSVTNGLPALCAGFSFERANNLRRDPSTVKRAGLWYNTLAIDKACIYPTSIESQISRY